MEEIKEIIETLGMLAKAQSSICLLSTSWVFTIAWVFAAERKKGTGLKRARAFLGFFWLPGLLVYYFLPDVQPDSRPRISPTLRRIPETVVAQQQSTPERSDSARRSIRETSDGASDAHQKRAASVKSSNDKTSDGTSLTKPQKTKSGQKGTQLPPEFRLRVLNGTQEGETFDLRPGSPIYIGTADSNQVRLHKGLDVARWHAAIEWEKTGPVLLDAGNGDQHDIFVNDIPAQVQKRPLKAGDTLKLGRLQLKFERIK